MPARIRHARGVHYNLLTVNALIALRFKGVIRIRRQEIRTSAKIPAGKIQYWGFIVAFQGPPPQTLAARRRYV